MKQGILKFSFYSAAVFGTATVVLLCGCTAESVPPQTVAPAAIRVASVAPNLTAMVMQLNAADQLAGCSSVCTATSNANLRDVPVIGGFGAPSLEMLITAKPTHLLYTELADPAMLHRIKSLGITPVALPCKQLEDIPAALLALGELLNRKEEAAKLASSFNVRFAALEEQQIKDRRPAVFIEIWPDPLTTAAPQTFVGQLVELAGGQPLNPGSAKHYLHVDSEWIVMQNPDIILCGYANNAGTVAEYIARRPGWRNVSAVKNGDIIADIDPDLLLQPGLDVLDAAEQLKRKITAWKKRHE